MMATLVRYHRKAVKLDDLPSFTLFKKSSSCRSFNYCVLACC